MIISINVDIRIILLIVFFGLAFIVGVVGLIKKSKKSRDDTEHKKKLVKDSKFISEKREKYEGMMNQYNKELKPEREKAKKLSIIYVIACLIPLILIFVTKDSRFLILFIIVLIGLGLIFGKKASGYFSGYAQRTNQTIATILKELDSNLDYYPSNGYKREEYMSLHFGEACDVYRSSDMILNNKSGFCYANVLTQREEEDDDHTYYETEFDGTLARLGIKNVGCTIILGGLSDYSFEKSKTFNKITLENDEFNDEFTCFSDNELTSYKILTPDIMEEFIKIKMNTIGDIDIRIVNDKLYIRFKNTNGFDGMGDDLFESVAVLEEIIKTMDKVKKIIDSKNMD